MGSIWTALGNRLETAWKRPTKPNSKRPKDGGKNLVFWVDGTCDIHRIDNVTEISLICHSSYTSWKKDRCPYWVSVLFLFEDSLRFSAFYIDLSHGMWTSDSRRKG